MGFSFLNLKSKFLNLRALRARWTSRLLCAAIARVIGLSGTVNRLTLGKDPVQGRRHKRWAVRTKQN